MTGPWDEPEGPEPERYWDAATGDARRRVVKSAILDVPSAEAKSRTMAMLGLDGGAMPSAPSSRRMGRWLGVGIAGLALLGGSATLFSRAPRATAIQVAATARAEAPVVAASAPLLSASTAPPVAEPVTAASAASPVFERRREPEDDLGPQLALIDGARAALAQGNAKEALTRLKEYEVRYPGGALGPEATALRVEALLRAGEVARGQALGKKFVSQHPNGPYAARIRSLLAESP
jgi:hypothetical protein